MSQLLNLRRIICYKDHNYEITPIKRYTTSGAAINDEEVDSYGFRKPLPNDYDISDIGTTQFTAEGLMSNQDFAGGIIVGEGDEGKSWFVEAMTAAQSEKIHVRSLALREYEHTPGDLRREARELWQQATSADEICNLILDGLDECPLAETVIEDIARHVQNAKCCHIWVTSRPCKEVDALVSSGTIRKQYHLLPFSVDDLDTLAKMVHEDGKKFVRTLKLKNIASFAAKPGDAVLLLKLYGEPDFEARSLVQLMESIADSFVRETIKGDPVPGYEEEIQSSKLVEAAAWIAVQMFLKDKKYLWTGTSLNCPSDALALDSLEDGTSSREALNIVVTRRVFEPMAQHKFRFACDVRMSAFLAAFWLNKHCTDEEQLRTFLNTDEGAGESTLAVMKWLCQYHPTLGKSWITLSPCSFIECAEAIELFGAKKYFKAMVSSIEKKVHHKGLNSLRLHGDQLYGHESLSTVALSQLGVPGCRPIEAEVASNLLFYVNTCRDKAIKVLVDYLLDHAKALSPVTTNEIIHNIYRLADEHDHPDLKRLKPYLLNFKGSGRLNEYIRGNLLLMLWPFNYLTTEELVTCLIKPARNNYFTYFDSFLRYSFIKSLKSHITKKNIPPLLTWASEHLYGEDNPDDLRETADILIRFAWQWMQEPVIAKAVARAYIRYSEISAELGNSEAVYDILCRNPYRVSLQAKECPITAESFSADIKGRIALVRELVHDPNAPGVMFGSSAYLVSEGICTQKDIQELMTLWSNSLDEEAFVEKRLSDILAVLLRNTPCDQFLSERKTLAAHHPDEVGFDPVRLASVQAKNHASIKKLHSDQAKRKAKEELERNMHRASFGKSIMEMKMKSWSYLYLACYMDSETKHSKTPSLDVTKAYQWQYLTDEQRRRVYEAALLTLAEFDKPITQISMSTARSFASAVRLTWDDETGSARHQSAARWGRIISILLLSYESTGEPTSEEYVKWGLDHYPDEVRDSVRDDIIAQIQSDEENTHILSRWIPYMNNEMMQELIATVETDEKKVMQILHCVNYHNSHDSVFPCIAEYLTRQLGPDTDLTANNPLSLNVASFCPSIYTHRILERMGNDKKKFTEWFKTAMCPLNCSALQHAFVHSEFGDMTRIYLWLSTDYPDENQPVHNLSYTVSMLDYIYELKETLLSALLSEHSLPILKQVEAYLKKVHHPDLDVSIKLLQQRYIEALPPRLTDENFIENILVPQNHDGDNGLTGLGEYAKRLIINYDQNSSLLELKNVGKIFISYKNGTQWTIIRRLLASTDIEGWTTLDQNASELTTIFCPSCPATMPKNRGFIADSRVFKLVFMGYDKATCQYRIVIPRNWRDRMSKVKGNRKPGPRKLKAVK